MKQRYAVLLLLIPLVLTAQTTGDYRSKVDKGFWDQASSWERFDGTNWVAASAAPTSSNDVYIMAGDTIDFGGSSSGSCKNLYIQAGAVLTSSNNNRSVTVNGGTIQCDGIIYYDGVTYRPMLQYAGTNCVLQGNGSVTLYRVRPASGGANYSFTFNMDAVVWNGGVYSNNVNNVTFIIAENKKLTLYNSYIGGASSKTGSVSNPFSIIVNGILDLDSTSVVNLNTSAASPASFTVNSNGTVVFQKTSTFAVSQGSPNITIDGLMQVKGTIDLADSPWFTIKGNGQFNLSDGALLRLRNLWHGLNPDTGVIRTTTRNFSTKASYTFIGNNLNMVTGPDFPERVGRLTISDSNGTVTLTNSVVIDTALVFVGGKLVTGTNNVTLAATAVVEGAGNNKFVEGNAVVTISTAGSISWPLGSDTLYLPATLYYSNVVVGGKIGLTINKLSETPPDLPIPLNIYQYNRYYSIIGIDPIDIEVDSLVISFAPTEIPATLHDSLQVICLREDKTQWYLPGHGSVDLTEGKITLTKDLSPTQYVIIGPAGIAEYDLASVDSTDFGTVAIGSTANNVLYFKNTGNKAFVVDSIVSKSEEFLVSAEPFVVLPGDTVEVNISFRPKSYGLRQGNLYVYLTGALTTVDSGEITGVGDVMKIRDARAVATGTEVYVKGVVTRTKGAYTFFQDSTGGLVIYGTSGAFYDSVASGYIRPGSIIYIHGKMYEFNGLKEIRINPDLIAWQKIDTTSIPVPITTWLSQIAEYGEQFESRLVQIPNVSIINTTDVAFAPSKNYDIVDPTDISNSVKLRIQAARDCELVGASIPTQPFNYIGVVGQYTTSTGGYQLLPIYLSDITVLTDVKEVKAGIPSVFEIYPAYPNPFNPVTSLKYGLPTQSNVTVKVYSLIGQEVATLYSGIQQAGYHTLRWDATKVSSGIYFIKLSAQAISGEKAGFNQVMKVVLMK